MAMWAELGMLGGPGTIRLAVLPAQDLRLAFSGQDLKTEHVNSAREKAIAP